MCSMLNLSFILLPKEELLKLSEPQFFSSVNWRNQYQAQCERNKMIRTGIFGKLVQWHGVRGLEKQELGD